MNMFMDDQIVSENLKCALEYAQMGFSVIPIGKDKKPLTSWKEWQSKRADESRIKSWFTERTMANIGIVTGQISGIVVVDIEADGNIDDLPKTVVSRTGGGGWHFYYKYDPQRPVKNYGRIRHLTDIRGDGGYIIAPPSTHQSGKQYAWETFLDKDSMSEFPYWILNTPSVESSLSSLSSENTPAKVSQGSRNETAAKIAGKIIQKLKTKTWEEVGWPNFQEWNSTTCQPPLDNTELRSIWNSIIMRESTKKSAKNKEEKDEETFAEIYWKRPVDGRIIEAYYDPLKEETGLLVFEDGKATKTNQVTIKDIIYKAPQPTNSLINLGFVKLPSEALPFDSETVLIQEIKDFIHDYVQIPADYEDIATFYALFSWVYDDFQELPYLRAIGDYGSGKSRFLNVMAAICCRAVTLNGTASASAIFRIIHEVNGTFVFDEGDLRFSDTSNEIVKILNSGFQKGFPVFRSEASGKNMKSYDPRPFNVYCPKIIATRKDFMDDALESRCLSNSMETLTRKDIPDNLESDFEDRALKLRNKLAMFRFLKLSTGISNEPLPKLNIEPRLRQIISPIYRIVSDPVSKSTILNFIRNKQQEVIERRYGSMEGELLQATIQAIELNPEPTMKEITNIYNENYGHKFPIKAKKTGSIIENIFHLKKKPTSKGIHICSNPENDHRIAELKVKFGIDKPEVNIVNDVNISTDGTQNI